MTHAASSHRPCVAVINDDTPFLELLQELLENVEGYEVKIRKEWDGAYDFVKKSMPDVVILDIVMGHEERGWRILEMLTLDPQTLPIPVIVCSAAVWSLQEHEDLLKKYGVQALAKPFDLDDLLHAIDSALSGAPRHDVAAT